MQRKNSYWRDSLVAQPALSWGLRMTPLLAFHIADLRAGLHSGDGGLQTTVSTSGLVATNLQLQFSKISMWSQNASQPDDTSSQRYIQLLGPLQPKADNIISMARDRRRMMMGILTPRSSAAPGHIGRPATGSAGRHVRTHVPREDTYWATARQQLLHPLEVVRFLRASDYAMFLLVGISQ